MNRRGFFGRVASVIAGATAGPKLLSAQRYFESLPAPSGLNEPLLSMREQMMARVINPPVVVRTGLPETYWRMLNEPGQPRVSTTELVAREQAHRATCPGCDVCDEDY